MLHLHFGTGRLGLGLVAPILRRSDASLFLLNRAVSSGSATGETTVDPARRNTLLQDHPHKTYALKTPGGNGEVRQQVSYDGFRSYTEENVAAIVEEILAQSPDAQAGVIVTASVLTVKHYTPVVDALNVLSEIRQRTPEALGDIYLIACENTVSAEDVMAHDGFARPPSDAAHKHIHCIHALVDRVCVELEEATIEGVPTLVVMAEEYAALKLELRPETQGLAELLKGTGATFSSHLAVEKDIKSWLLNGSHWLIALTAFQETNGNSSVKLNAWLAETANHHLFAEEIIDEMRDGIEALLFSDPQYADFVEHVDIADYLNNAAATILARFDANEDTIARILARFRTPTPESTTSVEQFIGRFLGRIEGPMMAFERKHRAPPKSTSHSLLNLFRLQAGGVYVDSQLSQQA